MAFPRLFTDFAKTCRDFNKQKEWDLKRASELKIRNGQPDVDMTVKVVENDKGIDVKFIGGCDIAKVGRSEVVIDTKKSLGTLEWKKALRDDVFVKIKAGNDLSGKATLQYRYKNFAAAQAEVEKNGNDIRLKPSLVIGFEGLACGASATLNHGGGEDVLSDYNAGVEYSKGASTLTLLTEETCNLVSGYYALTISDKSHIRYSATYDIVNSAMRASVGGQYKVHQDLKIKGRVSTEGNLDTVLTHKLSANAVLHLGATLNLTKWQKDDREIPRFGVKLCLQ